MRQEKESSLTFSRTAPGSIPNLSAIGTIRSGRLPRRAKDVRRNDCVFRTRINS